MAVQTFVGRRSFLAQLGNQTDMEYVLAFGATSSGPPPIDAAQQELDGASAEVLVVWTLSAVGSTFHALSRAQSRAAASILCGRTALADRTMALAATVRRLHSAMRAMAL